MGRGRPRKVHRKPALPEVCSLADAAKEDNGTDQVREEQPRTDYSLSTPTSVSMDGADISLRKRRCLRRNRSKDAIPVNGAGISEHNAAESIEAENGSVEQTRRMSPRRASSPLKKQFSGDASTTPNPLLWGTVLKKGDEETAVLPCPPTPDAASLNQMTLLSSISSCLEAAVIGPHPPTPPKASTYSTPVEGVSAGKADSYLVGDVVWARAVGYPWWPAMLIYEPDTGLFCDSKNRLHVQFFGEKVERAWSSSRLTKPFLSSSDISTFKEAALGKRHGGRLEKSWILACQQADSALELDRFARRSKFTCDFSQQCKASSSIAQPSTASAEVTKYTSVADPLAKKRASSDDAAQLHPPKKSNSLKTVPCSPEKDAPCSGMPVAAVATEDSSSKAKKPRTGGRNWLHELHVCLVCRGGSEPDEMVACSRGCGGQFHLECLGLSTAPSSFTCDECTTGISSCGVCRTTTGELKTCSASGCSKQYHLDCLQSFPTTKWPSKTRFVCPLHTCETCCHKDGRMDRCARCPAVFHSTAECLQAGYKRLNDTSIICLRHQVTTPQPVHLQYCYECGHTGTSRLDCACCPQSIEPGCLPEDERTALEGLDLLESKTAGKKSAQPKWVCSDCKSNSSLHFGNIVHCKIGVYRWWPAKIVHEDEMPENLRWRQPGVGHFLVYFYGSGDYAWTTRGRTIPFNGKHDMPRKGGKFRDAYAQGFAAAQEEWLTRKKAMKPYEHIKTNVPSHAITESGAYRKQKVLACMCTAEHPCSAESGCLNFVANYECDRSTCPAGDLCQNRRLQQRKGRQLKVITEGEKGYGVRCQEDVEAGEFVIEYCGEVMLEEEFRKRLNAFLDEGEDACFYFMRLGNGLFVDAGLKGNTARFINHSCSPNLHTERWVVQGRPRVGLFALKDIKKGDELSFDYQLDYCGMDRLTKCLCGAPNCSGFVGVRPKSSKPDKSEKQKKKKKLVRKARKPKVKKRLASDWEDDCFECGDEEGDLVMCDYPNCPKVYHLKCLEVEKVPHGSWWCPYHVCDECSVKAVQFCAFCSSSCCPRHPAVLRPYSNGTMMCSRHDEFDSLSAAGPTS